MRSVRGFTLIELLIVIAIIGLLSAVVLSALSTARMKGRDTGRMAEIQEMQKALEQYYAANGSYPGSTIGSFASTYDTTNGGDCGYLNNWCNLETILAPYIKQLPRDDMGGAFYNRRYNYKSNYPYQTYGLSVQLELPNTATTNDGGFYSSAYEVGDLPKYCQAKYTGNWMNWDSANACVGGN